MRKLFGPLILIAALHVVPGFAGTAVAMSAGQPAGEHASAEGDHGDPDAHHSSLSGLLWPTANFIILCGILYYFLKTPLQTYLADRGASIRKDLVDAANTKATAAAQLAEIDRKINALPEEIDALRRRGAQEIAAEERRITAQAAHDRERLVDQTRREIELQVRLARRELVQHAADLAVQLATDRIERTITADDQARLVDQYLDQVKTR